MAWQPLVEGLAASIFAAARIAGWLALGPGPIRPRKEATIDIAFALLFGSGVTATIHAVFASLGHVKAGIALDVVVCATALALRRERAGCLARHLVAVSSDYSMSRRGLLVLAPVALLYWVAAIAPPRDADVVRYHLAHVRQILAEDVWDPIPDCHYAMPFGWSLNYLPFELIGLPQAAHLLNLLVWGIAVSLMLAGLRGLAASADALLLCACFSLHPQVFRPATTAHVDAYSMLVVAAVGLLLTRLKEAGAREFLMLGFMAWIGAQSRYQAVAVGTSASFVVAAWFIRKSPSWGLLRAFLLGSCAAFGLAAPFYVVNAVAFGNPTWPLLTGVFGTGTHSDEVGAACFPAGPFAVEWRPWRPLTDPYLFPIPLLAVLLIPIGLRGRLGPTRPLAAFALTFLGQWCLMQPTPYGRFSLFLVPVVILGWASLLATPVLSPTTRGLARWALASATAGFLGLDAFSVRDNAEYLVTGDRRGFHQFTWFYPVYEWANRSTDPRARFLVVVTGGPTYYLDRPYRRADPTETAVVDWSSLRGPEDLEKVLSAGAYDYIVYEDRNWAGNNDGARMSSVIEGSIERGLLYEAARFELRLYRSRLWRDWYPTTVRVFARARDRHWNSSVGAP